MPRPMWDLEENKGYLTYNYNGTEINILKKQLTPDKSLQIMMKINDFIIKLSNYMKREFNNLPSNIKNGAILFITIHPRKHKLFEIEPGNQFYGLNKPKFVETNKYLPSVGKDGLLKARNRYLFFQLRNKNGTFKKDIELEQIVVHELAHTMANHVSWRDDDHKLDFIRCYNFLNKIILLI